MCCLLLAYIGKKGVGCWSPELVSGGGLKGEKVGAGGGAHPRASLMHDSLPHVLYPSHTTAPLAPWVRR